MDKYKAWHWCNIYKTAQIGDGTTIGCFSEIGHMVKIGKNCKIQAFVFIPQGIEIEDNCFIGPGVIFLNDKFPPSEGKYWGKILIKKGARIGGGCIILPDVEIGENSLIGAGSVVTESIPPNEIWFGSPAHFYKKITDEI